MELFHLEHPFSNTNFKDDTDDEALLHSVFFIELQHMPSSHYFNSLKSSASLLSNRNQAISSIIQFSRKFDDQSLTYLAVNYLDRFLSNEDMPFCQQETKPSVLKLISLSCVSLSVKMKKPDISVSDLLVEDEFFDAKMIKRMENVILGALKWRMRSVTPLCFFDFFISLFDLKEEDTLVLKHTLKSQAIDLTFNLQNDIRFLEFKPSVIAGAALLFTSFEQCPLKLPCFRNRILQCTYVNKDEFMECYKAIQERNTVEENVASTETTVNVLDHQFSSCESDKSSITITASSASSPKRRKTST